MKRLFALLAILVMLPGCTGAGDTLDRVMALRADLLASPCAFRAVVTADYGDAVHIFTMECRSETSGDLAFTVSAPESIAGITGKLSSEGGRLTFSDTALAFPLMADEQFSPVSAPWVLMQTLRGGYVTACGMEGETVRVTIHDSYEEDALMLDIWLDGNNLPARAEILWDGRRILTVEVENFEYL